MGITSFEHDPVCTRAAEAVRLLLKPSFHPEICITFADGRVSVVSAQEMIWHQYEPAPMQTDRSDAVVAQAAFAGLLASMVPAAPPTTDAVRGILLDGMQTELLHFRAGVLVGTKKGDYTAFIGHALALASELIPSPYCRNALADAAEYVGRRLPRVPEPPRKPVVKTVVLGTEEDRAQLMAALRTHDGGIT
jgi:hypothetical protein